MKIRSICFILLPALLWACGGPEKPGEAATAEEKKPAVAVPAFNADSAWEFIRAQVAFGPRVPNTPAHAKCAEYLTDRLRQYTPHVVVQKGQVYSYNKKALYFKNIIASWNPESANRILLCAHWDSRPWADHDPDPANRRKPVDGANDGASGVGVLMEVARQISLKTPQTGVDIILFDAEDYGPHQEEGVESHNEHWGLGSQYWAKNPHIPGYRAKFGILLDMVGAKGATFLMEGISMEFAADIVKMVWDKGNRIGYSSFFLYERGGPITDDHLPINQFLNIPTIDIIHLDRNTETGFYPGWHTSFDNLEQIDKYTLKAVGQTVLTVIYEE